MIVAKPVIPDQYWILRDQESKIGNIEIEGGEYIVNINGHRKRFENLDLLSNSIRIDFECSKPVTRAVQECSVHGYPTTGPAYNAVFDVKHQLPLWTSEPCSRSWLAAGWYRIKKNRDWQIVQCPKLIILQRYQYQGPFCDQEEARQA